MDFFSILKNEIDYNSRRLLDSINLNNYIDNIISIDNPYMYDRLIKYMEFKYDTAEFNEKRNKYIEKRILDAYDDGILKIFLGINKNNYQDSILFTDAEKKYLSQNIDKISELLKNISNRWIDEYIVYYFFQDNYYNFLVNLSQMSEYAKKFNNLVDLNNLKLYNEFNNISNLTVKEKIVLFKKYYNKNLMEMFYDDMRKTKDYSYERLVNASLKLNKNNNIYNSVLSNKYGIDVYYLNGEKFFAFVRCFNIERNDMSDKNDYIFSNLGNDSYSFSYISDKNIGTIDYEQKMVVLVYDSINPRNISYIHHSDIHKKSEKNKYTFLSYKINEIITPEKLISETNNYNEIVVNDTNIKPASLICYNEITSNDIAFANKYQLSILLINKDKYKRYEFYDEDFYDNTYVL